MKYFSSNMEYLRKSKSLKQNDMQYSIGIDRTTWSNYERGKSYPNLKLFHEIAKYFHISESDLLNSDLGNVHLNENYDNENTVSDVHLNVHPSVHLNKENKGKNKREGPEKEPCEQCLFKDQIIKAQRGEIEALKKAINHAEQRLHHEEQVKKQAS